MKWCVVRSCLLSVLLSCCRSQTSGQFKPVIIVHGLFDGPSQFQELARFISEEHKGTNVSILSKWSNLQSLRSLWTQEESFKLFVEAQLENAPDGAHLICFSQGGLICRALLSMMPNHNIHTFIALASPLAGQYGETDYFKQFPLIAVNELYKWCYGILGLLHLSICEFWNDPCHHDEYLEHNDFLALINGEKENNEIDLKEWRENFMKIKKLVLIGGEDDGVITPWQSSLFGFYNCGKDVVEMKDQQFYINDSFGLKTLDSEGKVHVCIQAGVEHTQWHQNHSVFKNCILGHLD